MSRDQLTADECSTLEARDGCQTAKIIPSESRQLEGSSGESGMVERLLRRVTSSRPNMINCQCCESDRKPKHTAPNNFSPN